MVGDNNHVHLHLCIPHIIRNRVYDIAVYALYSLNLPFQVSHAPAPLGCVNMKQHKLMPLYGRNRRFGLGPEVRVEVACRPLHFQWRKQSHFSDTLHKIHGGNHHAVAGKFWHHKIAKGAFSSGFIICRGNTFIRGPELLQFHGIGHTS